MEPCIPLPKTKVFLSQALSAGLSKLLLPQSFQDLISPVLLHYRAPWLSGIADNNGDFIPDFIVGAPGNDSFALDAGRVYVTFGSATGGTVATLGATLAGITVNGASAGDRAGTAVASIADLNGDGHADILIGAPGVDNGTALDAGAAYVVWGQALARV